MSDLRIQYDEEMVGAGHPTKEDTLNRLMLAEHDSGGLHQRTTLLVQEADPETGVDQAALYVKNSEGRPELFFRGANDGEVNQITQDGAVNSPDPGHVQGLTAVYKDADEITLTAGEITIQGGRYTCAGLDFELDAAYGSSLPASSWAAVYINASEAGGGAIGGSDLEVSATLPTWNSEHQAWYHPTNPAWRCPLERGWLVYADNSGDILPFRITGGWYNFYEGNIKALETYSPATSLSTFASLAPGLGIPLLLHLWALGQDDSNSFALVIADGDLESSSEADSIYFYSNNASAIQNQILTVLRTCNASGQLQYKMHAGDSAGIVRLKGFKLPVGGA